MKIGKRIKISLLVFCITIMTTTSVFAASNYYHEYGFGNQTMHLYYWKDASVSTYGYTSLTDDGFNAWDGITDALKFHEVTTQPTYGSINAYVGETLAGLDVYGAVDYWRYGLFGWTQVNPDSARDRARVRFDHTNISSMSSRDLKQYVFTHEFGHAVGLKHNNDPGVASVMRDDTIVATSNMPQAIDKYYIIEKYEN